MDNLIETGAIPRFRQESAAAEPFEDFFEREYPRLVRLLRPSTDDLGAAEELAQEAMTRVFERWTRVSRMDSALAYAYVVGINANRRRHRRLWSPLSPSEPDRRSDPASEVVNRDQLLGALAKLPQSERDALLLVSVLGLSAEEAGRKLKIKAVSVRSRVHRARSSLKEQEGDS